MSRNTIHFAPTGDRSRARQYGYHGGANPRDLSLVTRADFKGVKSRYFKEVDAGKKYVRSNFTIGFEVEKTDIDSSARKEYALFKGYESDSSLSSGGNSGEAITNILPLVPMGYLRNKVMNMIVNASPVLDSPYDISCGGHITIRVEGLNSQQLRQRMRAHAGIVYALYKGRLSRNTCNGNIFLEYNRTNRGVTTCKGNGLLEWRLPSAISSTGSFIRRYELFFELVDIAVNSPNARFNTAVKRVRPILERMYTRGDGSIDSARVNSIVDYALDFQKLIDTGKCSRRIVGFLPDYARSNDSDSAHPMGFELVD